MASKRSETSPFEFFTQPDGPSSTPYRRARSLLETATGDFSLMAQHVDACAPSGGWSIDQWVLCILRSCKNALQRVSSALRQPPVT
eukprot:1239532-Karenia_brevis.AAC.1